MGGACSRYGGGKKFIQNFGGEIDHLDDPGVDGRILRWIFRKWKGEHRLERNWLRIWRALVNAGNLLTN